MLNFKEHTGFLSKIELQKDAFVTLLKTQILIATIVHRDGKEQKNIKISENLQNCKESDNSHNDIRYPKNCKPKS